MIVQYGVPGKEYIDRGKIASGDAIWISILICPDGDMEIEV
jgi:hypothetical protein